MKAIVNGWMTYFGSPDELVLDAGGCCRGYRCETLQAQCAVKFRYLPADAHFQFRKAERHGQAIRYMVKSLVSQFCPTVAQEMNVIVAMAAAAKNSLLRRASSSPAQFVFGRNPKLPGALLSTGGNIESCQLADDSAREQCRPDHAACEEEWWTSDPEDLRLLKNVEEEPHPGVAHMCPRPRSSRTPDSPLTSDLVTDFRSGIGSLQWLAGTTRGDISSETSFLQKSLSDLTVSDLVEVNGAKVHPGHERRLREDRSRGPQQAGLRLLR